MKGRESGMPEKDMWEQFFVPEKILKTLGLNRKIRDAAEFGCGYGTFTIPAARIIQGKICGLDIEPEMTALTLEEAQRAGLNNVETLTRDFIAEGTGLENTSVDYVMLFNILHIENPGRLLREARRILVPAGRLGILHWNYDPSTPRGPSMEVRPRPEQCIAWAEEAGFVKPMRYDLKPYHYGIVMLRADDGEH